MGAIEQAGLAWASDEVSKLGSGGVAGEAGESASSIFSSMHLPDWAVPALEQVMPMVAGAALKPKRNPTAPLGGAGHSVNANTTGYDSILKGAQKVGTDDPLQGLTSFKNLL